MSRGDPALARCPPVSWPILTRSAGRKPTLGVLWPASELYGWDSDGLLRLYSALLKGQQSYSVYPIDLDAYLDQQIPDAEAGDAEARRPPESTQHGSLVVGSQDAGLGRTSESP